MLKKMALANLSRIINLAIALDPLFKESLVQFDGKIICLSIDGIPGNFYISFNHKGITFVEQTSQSFDITIKGTPLSLLQLTLDDKSALNSGKISIEGDMIFAQQLTHCVKQLDLDFEEALSKVFGDVIAHELGKFSRNSRQQVQHKTNIFVTNLSEYLQEESGLLIAPIAVENFMEDVTELKLDVERLEAKIQRLQQYCEKSSVDD